MKLSTTACTEKSEWCKKFELKELECRSVVCYHIYLREVQVVLKSQHSCTNGHERFLDVRESSEQFHAMSSYIRLHACWQAMRPVKSSGDTEVSRKSAATDVIDSRIGCIHLFCDKYLTSSLQALYNFIHLL